MLPWNSVTEIFHFVLLSIIGMETKALQQCMVTPVWDGFAWPTATYGVLSPP